MDISQFFTATDLFGIVPEIILTVTALSVLALEMAHIFHPRIILIVAALGLLLAGAVVIQTSGDEQILFGGMLALNQYSTFFDFLSRLSGEKRESLSWRIPCAYPLCGYWHDVDDESQ